MDHFWRAPKKGPPKRSTPLFSPDEARRVRAALKTARFMFGTWACFADAMGVRGNRAQRIACGVRPVGGEIAIRLARALGIPLEALLREPDHGRLRAPASAVDDVRQMVLFTTRREAARGRIRWTHRPSLRAFLRIVTARALFEWWTRNPILDEMGDDDAVVDLDAERLVIARGMLRFLRTSTTPERWRAVRPRAQGIPAHAIAEREHVPTATVYNWIRLAREDIGRALARDDASIYVRRRK